MEKKVIRSGVFVKIIGIITTAIFSLVSLFPCHNRKHHGFHLLFTICGAGDPAPPGL